MATVNGPLLPKIDKAFNVGSVGNLEHSKTHIGKLRRYLIDNPKDEGLKRRETLWDFQQKNRGALVRIKGEISGKIIVNDQNGRTSPNSDENHQTLDKSSEIEKGRNFKAIQFKKLKRKQRLESRVLLGSNDLSDVRGKDPSVTYSTSLRIGNNIFNQMKAAEQPKSSSQNMIYSDDVKKAIVRSIDKLPDLSASLSKLGYLKMTKNVVHYGGGFFGRHSERPYAKMRRSWSTLSPPEVRERIHGRVVAPTTAPSQENKTENTTLLLQKRLEYLDTLSIQQSTSHRASTSSRDEESGSVSTTDNSSKKTSKSLMSKTTQQTTLDDKRSLPIIDHARKREKRLRKLREQQTARVFAPMISKQSLEEKRDKTERKIFVEAADSRQRKLAVIRRERSKAKSDLENFKRVVSEQGLDLPKDKYGPTTHSKDNKRPTLYGSNPYRWTSKTSLSLDDRTWVKRTMQQADVVDHSAYESFARIKPSTLQKGGTELSLDRQKRSTDAKKLE
ncbi:uncharacterized protein LOC110461814 isoform X1 [Mizuhopecten yessoensis]|uniref:Uncharacterized protein n=1 Tax=Mizuhopecten yessoensis TaxID=6573 RepID=A0A210R2Z4_MIZYE|nr:uncharacterized protein LOC110461814 isoform X1 [Mizuhopecten yessoensis]XP_021371180.1 uncharacterized protein LOC110461814 isoform X2 [Mizuhopecten yessoensis]XP_021371188.1 uncharacterized protein LOC110461814 isoform X1 [Mizuhopecten yessoensis]XP_021371192.1 uncharacterized protein LOC110461814 isoform X1 [Mizuhopecten yessoensis]XP_021371200.1 uncharacterized protein LOC110461814 isoform X1 [Mizuhopecten yessoensis]XP_021371209.1 uncharacterized protein LOC110461814 isoform X1 [Mizuho